MLLHNYNWFYFKALVASHPVIQEDFDELFALGPIEPSTSVTDLYSSVSVVPTCMGGLHPIFNVK